MENSNLKSSKRRITLMFREQEQEENYKREKHISARRLFLKFAIVLTILQILTFLASVSVVISEYTSTKSRAWFLMRICTTPISILIFLIEYLLMKYDIRKLRGILFIIRCFALMAIDPWLGVAIISYT